MTRGLLSDTSIFINKISWGSFKSSIITRFLIISVVIDENINGYQYLIKMLLYRLCWIFFHLRWQSHPTVWVNFAFAIWQHPSVNSIRLRISDFGLLSHSGPEKIRNPELCRDPWSISIKMTTFRAAGALIRGLTAKNVHGVLLRGEQFFNSNFSILLILYMSHYKTFTIPPISKRSYVGPQCPCC